MITDLGYTLRVPRKAPGFALVVVLTLGLGTGAATAIFSVVNGLLLNPLPYPDADRLVVMWQGRHGQDVEEVLSYELWNGVYGADPDIVGKTVTLSGVDTEIVGVLSRAALLSQRNREDYNVSGVPKLEGLPGSSVSNPGETPNSPARVAGPTGGRS